MHKLTYKKHVNHVNTDVTSGCRLNYWCNSKLIHLWQLFKWLFCQLCIYLTLGSFKINLSCLYSTTSQRSHVNKTPHSRNQVCVGVWQQSLDLYYSQALGHEISDRGLSGGDKRQPFDPKLLSTKMKLITLVTLSSSGKDNDFLWFQINSLICLLYDM